MSTTTVHLVRHGEVRNPERILYGRLPGYRLTERGEKMAAMVGDHLAAADVALVLIDLIRSGDLDRLGRCAAEHCRAYLADFSRNRSKRFCDTGSCATRTHVAAFRARHSGADSHN